MEAIVPTIFIGSIVLLLLYLIIKRIREKENENFEDRSN